MVFLLSFVLQWIMVTSQPPIVVRLQRLWGPYFGCSTCCFFNHNPPSTSIVLPHPKINLHNWFLGHFYFWSLIFQVTSTSSTCVPPPTMFLLFQWYVGSLPSFNFYAGPMPFFLLLTSPSTPILHQSEGITPLEVPILDVTPFYVDTLLVIELPQWS